MSEWIGVTDKLPPEGVEVLTKIDDRAGIRNVSPLTRRGSLWFTPENCTCGKASTSMYVYYTPTHWQKKERN